MNKNITGYNSNNYIQNHIILQCMDLSKFETRRIQTTTCMGDETNIYLKSEANYKYFFTSPIDCGTISYLDLI